MGIIQDTELILEPDPERQQVFYEALNPEAEKHIKAILADFFEIITDGLDTFPLELRTIASFIYTELQKKGEDGLPLVKQLIFDHFLLQAFEEPQFFLQLVGVNLHAYASVNMQLLKRTISAVSTEEPHMKEYLMHLVAPDAGAFCNIVETDPLGQRSYTFTKSEWELLFQFFEAMVKNINSSQHSYKHLPSPIKEQDDPIANFVNMFLEITRKEKKYCGLNPRKLIKLEEPYIFKPTKAPPSEKASKEARKSFIQVLTDVSFLPRFHTKRSIIDYLSVMGASSLNKDQVSLRSSSKTLIVSLEALPLQYKERDYALLLDLVVKDLEFMKQELSSRMNEILHAWDQLQHCTWRMGSQKRVLEDYFTSKKLRDFRRKSFGTIQDK